MAEQAAVVAQAALVQQQRKSVLVKLSALQFSMSRTVTAAKQTAPSERLLTAMKVSLHARKTKELLEAPQCEETAETTSGFLHQAPSQE